LIKFDPLVTALNAGYCAQCGVSADTISAENLSMHSYQFLMTVCKQQLTEPQFLSGVSYVKTHWQEKKQPAK